MLWSVNLAGRTLLYGKQKFKAVLLPTPMFRDLLRSVSFFSKWKFKTFFYFWNCVFKPANLKEVSGWLVLLSRCVRCLKPYRVNRNRSQTRQARGKQNIFNKFTSVFHASVLLLIMNFVRTLSKYLWIHEVIAEWIRRLLWQCYDEILCQ